MNIYYLFSIKEKCFTELSIILKKKNVFSSFYGLAYAKSPTLNNNIYTKISYISDIVKKQGTVDYLFLEKLEKKYNVNISTMIHTDRHLLRYEKSKRLFLAQEILRVFIKEMKDYRITTIFTSGVTDLISYFAAFYCEHHSINFFHTSHVGYAGRACLSNNIYADPNAFTQSFEKSLQLAKTGKIDISAVETELQKYRDSKKNPSYMTASDATYHVFRLNDITVFFQYLFAYINDRKAMHYDKFPLFIPFYRLVKILRNLRYRHFLSKASIQLDKLDKINFFVYPLQLEPETSTLVQGRWFNDQRKIIEMISKNLPVNSILLVKEHKFSLGRRPLDFYLDIARHHNVFFIDDRTDNHKLIGKSKGVIVISSTMGLEALILGKPVMTFGQRFYNTSCNVYHVNNFKCLDQLLLKMLDHKFDIIDNIALFYTLFTHTKNDLGFLLHSTYTQKDLENLADELNITVNSSKTESFSNEEKKHNIIKLG